MSGCRLSDAIRRGFRLRASRVQGSPGAATTGDAHHSRLWQLRMLPRVLPHLIVVPLISLCPTLLHPCPHRYLHLHIVFTLSLNFAFTFA